MARTQLLDRSLGSSPHSAALPSRVTTAERENEALRTEVRQLRAQLAELEARDRSAESQAQLYPQSLHIPVLVEVLAGVGQECHIRVTAYTLDLCRAVEALVSAAQRGATVQVLLDSSKTTSLACNSTAAAVEALLEAGAALRRLSGRPATKANPFPGALHAKSIGLSVKDQTGECPRVANPRPFQPQVWLGSHNFTGASEGNEELMARLTHSEVLRGYESWFDGMWSRGFPLRDVPARRRLRGKQSVAAASTG